MSIFQILILAVIQGAAELLPVSSSAHVIVAEKFMGLDPSAPEMTFLLVMLHTGTMFAVLLYFWPRWKKWKSDFLKMAILATAVTGVLGLSLKKFIEKVILGYLLGESKGEIEHLFKSLPLISFSLFLAGSIILIAGLKENKAGKNEVTPKNSILIGFVQGLCLPFRGFSRSGATISAAMLSGISRALAEDFSFVLAVLLTPPVILHELQRLLEASGSGQMSANEVGSLLLPGLIGAVFSFGAGLLALRWLSAWLEQGKWKYFGIYCFAASATVLTLNFTVFSQ
jgi:undecaprenyl-diphosphatase